MDKKPNIRVIAVPIDTYDRECLNSLKDEDLSELALADANCEIYSSLLEFQELLNNDEIDTENNWIYFLTDLM